MTTPPGDEVTHLLLAWSNGDRAALDKLSFIVSKQLHSLAMQYRAVDNPGHTLQTTALVNEVYVRLIDGGRVNLRNRAHFFALSAQVMRRILVDFARSRQNLKRGGPAHRVSFD